ncbi:hypothetical protein M440DRAFT_1311885, partial [Trichoderma longibrachiatum ATCC 18648]
LVRLIRGLYVPFLLPKGYAQRTGSLVSGQYVLRTSARNAAFYTVEEHLDPCLIRSSASSPTRQPAHKQKRGVFL